MPASRTRALGSSSGAREGSSPERALDDRSVPRNEAAGNAAVVEPRRSVLAEKERGFRGDVGGETARAGRSDLLPRRVTRLARTRVDEVASARGGAARREAALDHADRAAVRQRHVDRAADGDVAAGRDE